MFQKRYLMLIMICYECQLSASRHLTLYNKNLTVAAEPWPPYLVAKKDERGMDTFSGPVWDFLQFIKEARNCTFKVVRPIDGLFGNCNGTNNCTGMIGQVVRKEADFALGKY